MENRKLVKEIITTETEKFTEDGKIKERVKETREKVYSNNFSKKEIDEAKVADKETSKKQPKKEVEQSDSELIKSAAEKIDREHKEEAKKQKPVEQPVVSPQPAVSAVPNPYQAYIQAQAPAQPGQATPKFPWET